MANDVESDVGGMPTERLEAEVCSLAAQLTVGEARFLLMVGELDRRGAHEAWGVPSLAYWLGWQCGIGAVAAREKVRVARALTALPLVRAAFLEGRLSYSKVRAITRVATPTVEQDLVDLALASTAAMVERICRAWFSTLAQTEESARRALEERRVADGFEDDGSYRLTACLPADGGALTRAALRKAMGAVGADRARTFAQRRADAFELIMAAYVSGSSSRVGGRVEVQVHADPATFSGKGEGSTCCHLEDGPAVAPSVAQRLACDAVVVAALEADGQVLRVGAPTEAVPAGLRRAVRLRDRQCRFPGCTHLVWLDVHHVIPRSAHGPTDLENLACLCRFHHRLVHEGGFSMVHDSEGGFVFFTPCGRPLVPVPTAPTPDVTIESTNATAECTPARDALRPQWCGERLDLGLITSSLWANHERNASAEARHGDASQPTDASAQARHGDDASAEARPDDPPGDRAA